MVMDVVRTCYVRDCQFFRDADFPIPVKWYRCPEGAKPFPFAHKVNSLYWYSEPWNATGVGEVFESAVSYANGFTPPSVTGQAFCGEIEDFTMGPIFNPLNDTPRDEWGVALCCNTASPSILLREEPGPSAILQEDGTYIFIEGP